jgi:hypothetical protein
MARATSCARPTSPASNDLPRLTSKEMS